MQAISEYTAYFVAAFLNVGTTLNDALLIFVKNFEVSSPLVYILLMYDISVVLLSLKIARVKFLDAPVSDFTVILAVLPSPIL